MSSPELPHDVREVLARTLTCELTTLTRREKRPVTAPMLHLWRPSQGDFILSRFYRIQRDPHVSLPFTKFAGTGLTDQLVQGTATVDDKVYRAEGMETSGANSSAKNRPRRTWSSTPTTPCRHQGVDVVASPDRRPALRGIPGEQ